jgi:outer membrane lipoprotein-sorting protein
MNLLLAAVLLLQDNSAKETWKKVEDTVLAAKTVRIKFQWEPQMKEGALKGKDAYASGVLLVKQGNLFSLRAELKSEQRDLEVEILSDGSSLYRKLDLLNTRRDPVPPNLGRGFLVSSVRASIMMSVSFSQLGRPKVGTEDLEKYLAHPVEVSDVQDGADDKGAKTLEYKIRVRPGQTASIRVWYDPKTFLPQKRSIRREDQDAGTITETFEEFVLNADIPDEKFKLPEEKK